MITIAIRNVTTKKITILGGIDSAADYCGLKNPIFVGRRIGKIVCGYEYLDVTGCFLDGLGI